MGFDGEDAGGQITQHLHALGRLWILALGSAELKKRFEQRRDRVRCGG